MKKYLILTLLSFILVSCNDTETQTRILEVPDKNEQEIPKSKDDTLLKVDNSWIEYKNSEYGFSISYPKQAYHVTCNPKDELVELKIFQSGSIFSIGYSKEVKRTMDNGVSKCEMVDNNDSSFDITLFDAGSKEEFVNKAYSKGVCKIDTTEKWLDSNNMEQINVIIKPEIRKCIESNTCPEYSIWDCKNYAYNLYDNKVNKGVTISYSSADYFFQKYSTYQETIDKGAYDREITNTFKFE